MRHVFRPAGHFQTVEFYRTVVNTWPGATARLPQRAVRNRPSKPCRPRANAPCLPKKGAISPHPFQPHPWNPKKPWVFPMKVETSLEIWRVNSPFFHEGCEFLLMDFSWICKKDTDGKSSKSSLPNGEEFHGTKSKITLHKSKFVGSLEMLCRHFQ